MITIDGIAMRIVSVTRSAREMASHFEVKQPGRDRIWMVCVYDHEIEDGTVTLEVAS